MKLIERPTIEIDFRDCVTTNDIRDLLKKNLNLPEWDDKNPDDLLRLLKEFKPCRIYFIGTNLIPAHISGYMKQIIDIFDGVEDKYNNMMVYVRDVVTIDFTGVNDILDLHKRISDKLDFPEWYGRNFDALWDLLIRDIPCYEIHLKGTREDDGYVSPYIQKIIDIFQRSERKYNAHKIIVE